MLINWKDLPELALACRTLRRYVIGDAHISDVSQMLMQTAGIVLLIKFVRAGFVIENIQFSCAAVGLVL